MYGRIRIRTEIPRTKGEIRNFQVSKLRSCEAKKITAQATIIKDKIEKTELDFVLNYLDWTKGLLSDGEFEKSRDHLCEKREKLDRIYNSLIKQKGLLDRICKG